MQPSDSRIKTSYAFFAAWFGGSFTTGTSSPSAVANAIWWSCSSMRISRMCSAIAYSPNCSHWRTRSRIIADGLAFIDQIKAQHFAGLFRSADGFRLDGGHSPEVINLVGNHQRMGEFFGRVLFQFCGDIHEFGALQHLRIHHVGNDGLILAGQVFVQ